MAAGALSQGVRRVLLGQAMLTLLVGGVFLVVRGGFDALSACYGGAIALIGTWWLGRSVQRAGDVAGHDVLRGQLRLYAGAGLRFAATLLLLVLGMGVLKFAPLPLIIAFAAAQFGFLANLGGAHGRRMG